MRGSATARKGGQNREKALGYPISAKHHIKRLLAKPLGAIKGKGCAKPKKGGSAKADARACVFGCAWAQKWGLLRGSRKSPVANEHWRWGVAPLPFLEGAERPTTAKGATPNANAHSFALKGMKRPPKMPPFAPQQPIKTQALASAFAPPF